MLLFFSIDLFTGVVHIPIKDIVFNSLNSKQKIILFDYRLPKILMVMLTGLGISIAGQIMQVLFNNPLAGPYVLGVSSGASLGASLIIITPSFLPFLSIELGAVLGALVVCVILYQSLKYFSNLNAVLILGVLISSICVAIISVLQFFGSETLIKRYLVWSMGSFSNTSKNDLFFLSFMIISIVGVILYNSRNLQALLLGRDYARSVGVDALRIEKLMMILVSLLVGVITAEVGPIAFIGIVIPYISRLLIGNSNYFVLLIVTGFLGVNLLLISDILTQRIIFNQILPINSITSIIGAPIVFVIFIKLSKRNF